MSTFLSKKQMRIVLALLSNNKSLKKSKGVGIVVEIPDGRILMGRQNASGKWSLPGGATEGKETPKEAVLRELKEETGCEIDKGTVDHDFELIEETPNGDKAFYSKLAIIPTVKNTEELTDVGFYYLSDIMDHDVRPCSLSTLKIYGDKYLKKSKKLQDMVSYEKLAKNILRTGSDAIHEITHGDSLKLVGNGVFRFIKNAVADMENDSIKEVKLGTYKIHIRKHISDVYSGRIEDGIKVVHQFVNRSLPALTAELMSVFEWYSEDELPLESEDKLNNETITDGISKLYSNYKNHNLGDIYTEVENIREEIRNGVAIDVQQMEQRVLKLFAKLEDTLNTLQHKHNILIETLDSEFDNIENKLRELQSTLDSRNKPKDSVIQAISSGPVDSSKIHNEFYSYLPKPQIVIEPTGKITISFSHDWSNEDKTNFLTDMKAKAVSKNGGK